MTEKKIDDDMLKTLNKDGIVFAFLYAGKTGPAALENPDWNIPGEYGNGFHLLYSLGKFFRDCSRDGLLSFRDGYTGFLGDSRGTADRRLLAFSSLADSIHDNPKKEESYIHLPGLALDPGKIEIFYGKSIKC